MNVPDILSDLDIPYRSAGESPHVTQGWVGLECPFCGVGTGKHGLGIHLESGAVSCWRK